MACIDVLGERVDADTLEPTDECGGAGGGDDVTKFGPGGGVIVDADGTRHEVAGLPEVSDATLSQQRNELAQLILTSSFAAGETVTPQEAFRLAAVSLKILPDSQAPGGGPTLVPVTIDGQTFNVSPNTAGTLAQSNFQHTTLSAGDRNRFLTDLLQMNQNGGQFAASLGFQQAELDASIAQAEKNRLQETAEREGSEAFAAEQAILDRLFALTQQRTNLADTAEGRAFTAEESAIDRQLVQQQGDLDRQLAVAQQNAQLADTAAGREFAGGESALDRAQRLQEQNAALTEAQIGRQFIGGESAIDRAQALAQQNAQLADTAAGRQFAGGESALERALAASQFAATQGLNENRFGLDVAQAQFGQNRAVQQDALNAADQLARLISLTDPAAQAAFQEAGGGVISNAIASGADALSQNALLPAARTLRGLEAPINAQLPEFQTPGFNFTPGTNPALGQDPITAQFNPATNPALGLDPTQIQASGAVNPALGAAPTQAVFGGTSAPLATAQAPPAPVLSPLTAPAPTQAPTGSLGGGLPVSTASSVIQPATSSSDSTPIVSPSGNQVIQRADGSVVIINADGSETLLRSGGADGTVGVDPALQSGGSGDLAIRPGDPGFVDPLQQAFQETSALAPLTNTSGGTAVAGPTVEAQQQQQAGQNALLAFAGAPVPAPTTDTQTRINSANDALLAFANPPSLAHGGRLSAGIAKVGDHASGRPTGVEEFIIDPTRDARVISRTGQPDAFRALMQQSVAGLAGGGLVDQTVRQPSPFGGAEVTGAVQPIDFSQQLLQPTSPGGGFNLQAPVQGVQPIQPIGSPQILDPGFGVQPAPAPPPTAFDRAQQAVTTPPTINVPSQFTTGADDPFLNRIRGIRQGVDTAPPIPGGAFNVGFQNLAPSLQQRFFAALQSRFGVPQQDLRAEQARFALQGTGRQLALGR